MLGVVTAATLLLNAHGAAQSRTEPCDRNLVTLQSSPLGYRLRGERCEGLYVEKISGTAILIASWTALFDDFDATRPPKLTLTWDAPTGVGSVRLRAQGLRRRLYYRMDAVRPGGSSSFVWPTDLLTELRIPRRDLGVVALVSTAVGGSEREVYLPLRIASGAPPTPSATYRLTILPSTELSEVYVSLLMAGQSSNTVLKDGEPLGFGYYPANRPFEIDLTGFGAKGFYQLSLAATLKSGGATTTEAWLYHPGS